MGKWLVATSWLLALAACHSGDKAVSNRGVQAGSIDGVYMTCDEISGFAGVTLELSNNQFRMWRYSDVGPRSSEQPICGMFMRAGTQVQLQTGPSQSRIWVFEDVYGVSAMWTPEALESWHSNERILNRYQVLFKTDAQRVQDTMPVRPSIEAIKKAERKAG